MHSVYLLLVEDNEGGVILRAVFSSKDRALYYLAKWCRSSWEEQGGHDEPLPNITTGDTIDRYFDFWHPEQCYELALMTIDPDK